MSWDGNLALSRSSSDDCKSFTIELHGNADGLWGTLFHSVISDFLSQTLNIKDTKSMPRLLQNPKGVQRFSHFRMWYDLLSSLCHYKDECERIDRPSYNLQSQREDWTHNNTIPLKKHPILPPKNREKLRIEMSSISIEGYSLFHSFVLVLRFLIPVLGNQGGRIQVGLRRRDKGDLYR